LYFFLLKKPGLSVKIKIAILGLGACVATLLVSSKLVDKVKALSSLFFYAEKKNGMDNKFHSAPYTTFNSILRKQPTPVAV
jgi:hypothetical protein